MTYYIQLKYWSIPEGCISWEGDGVVILNERLFGLLAAGLGSVEAGFCNVAARFAAVAAPESIIWGNKCKCMLY